MKNVGVNNKSQAFRSFLIGGLLPVIAFTVIEEKYGTLAGIIAGMVFGLGEIAWEWYSARKVSGITLGGNIALLILGAISLIANEGIWFKLQPSIMEALFALVLFGTHFMRKPLLLQLAKKQGQQIPPHLEPALTRLGLRLGCFFLLHAGLAAWAALYWSTRAWALLKGVGFTVSLLVYMLVEMYFIRRSALKSAQK
jgi:intracellular septation protein